ncbi:unnamed protein product (macronuclear) [Paramecium tetraurelia]|uniref:Uncharacterized protein n=1 Tax=Paramecium tetraurelia TaxID=5888 RepID=A0DYK2_PARTE|nr:uncharacterized protein GSPATT00003087001 [Paramecium tetraurelia]CAK88119.1 unnamed protein product [Paramecium tetraurelia]|eukprot:XP_001455516.1 hypothetical protein (macronuclear) [Paramecium tetraurelia strain d4-2]
MGGTCQKQINIPEQENNKSKQPQIYIKGPPKLCKPSPIKILQFQADEVAIEKELCISLPKLLSQEKEFAITEQEMPIQNVKNSLEEELLFRQESDQLEQQNNSKEEGNSQKNEVKGSSNYISKHKSILKNKMNNGSNPQSPKNQMKDSQNFGSQRSIKKVTFDKKQKVVYSSFRKIKT